MPVPLVQQAGRPGAGNDRLHAHFLVVRAEAQRPQQRLRPARAGEQGDPRLRPDARDVHVPVPDPSPAGQDQPLHVNKRRARLDAEEPGEQRRRPQYPRPQHLVGD
ncbi:MAG TPA: hypothetical protein VK817_19085, partial [Trebonia sp.]|nr:hypothetical protein [Trebonia sp.]